MSTASWSPPPRAPYACEPTRRPFRPPLPTQRDCDAFDGSLRYGQGPEEWQDVGQGRAWTRETWPSLPPPPPREAANNVVLPLPFPLSPYAYSHSDDFTPRTYASPPFPPYPPSRSFPPPPPHPSTAYYPSSSAAAASNPPISRLPRFLPRPPVRSPPVHPQDVETPASSAHSSVMSSSASSASSFSSSDTSSTHQVSRTKRRLGERTQEDDDDGQETADSYSRPSPPSRPAVFGAARQLRLACASLVLAGTAEEDQEERRKRSKMEERKREVRRRLDKLTKEEKTEVETFPIPTAPHSSFSFYVASLPPPPSSLPLKPSFPCVLPGEALPPETTPTDVQHPSEGQEEREVTERRTAREAQRLRGRLVRERWESVACTALEEEV